MAAQLPHNITALACKGDLTFAAVKSDIIACKRTHRCPRLAETCQRCPFQGCTPFVVRAYAIQGSLTWLLLICLG